MAIKQTISLDGLQTVQEELKNLADVGESAFERIRAAVEGGGSGLESIASNILNIGKALTSLTGAVTVFAGITGGLVGITVSASNAGEEFENLATQLGTTTETASALISSFARAGADIQGLSGQLRRAAQSISAEWAQIQNSVREAGLKTIANNIAVEQSMNNLAKANVAAAEQEHNAALQRQSDSLAVADAQANLDDLLEKQRIAQGGARDPLLEQERAQAREEQQIAKARLQLAQAQQKAKEDAALAEQRAAESAIAAETAQLALDKARLQASEDQKNSVTNLVGFVNDLANGLTNTGRAVNATVENIFRGIVASAGGLDAALGPIEGDISKIASPTVLNTLFKLSDVLKNMSSETDKTALASKLLGRTVGQEEVAFLSQGSAAIQKHIADVKALGLEFSTGMAEATQKFRRSLFTLEDTLSRLKDQIGATFAPVFGPFFETLGNLLAQNRTLFLNWAQTLASTVKPTLDSIIRVLSGQANEVDDKWLLDIIATFKNLGTTISSIVVPAFKSLIDIIGFIAQEINKLFGTNLDATSLIFLVWVTKILGGFKLISVGIDLLVAAFTAFAARTGIALAPVLISISAIALAFLAILALVDKATFEGLKQLGSDLVDLGKKMLNNFGKPVEDTTKAAENNFDGLIEKANQLGTTGEKAGGEVAAGFDKVKTSIDAANQSSKQLTQSVENNATIMKGALGQIPVAQPQVFSGVATPSFITGTGFDATRQGLQQFGLQQPGQTQQSQQPQQQIQQQTQQQAQVAVQAFQQASDQIVAIWTQLPALLSAIDFTSIVNKDALVAPFSNAKDEISAIFSSIAEAAEQTAQRIAAAMQQALQAIQSAQQAQSSDSFGLQFAAGGRVSGPGSWTSDSIPAWLSRDEFVQPAFRVHQYGMDFMEAIRRGMLSTDSVRMLMGDFSGFRFGGMVMPRFAEGGAVTAAGNVSTLNLVLGGKTFTTTGPAKVIAALEREAALAGISSTGIAQSFVGRR